MASMHFTQVRGTYFSQTKNQYFLESVCNSLEELDPDYRSYFLSIADDNCADLIFWSVQHVVQTFNLKLNQNTGLSVSLLSRLYYISRDVHSLFCGVNVGEIEEKDAIDINCELEQLKLDFNLVQQSVCAEDESLVSDVIQDFRK